MINSNKGIRFTQGVLLTASALSIPTLISSQELRSFQDSCTNDSGIPQYGTASCTEKLSCKSANTIGIEYEKTNFLIDGKIEISLLKKLQLEQTDTYTYKIKDWGIEAEFLNLDRLVARTFIEIWSKHIHNTLSEEEYDIFSNICKYVDITKYNIDTQPLQYLTGRLLTKNAQNSIVGWTLGDHEKLTGKLHTALQLIEKNEYFSCYGKFDQDGHIIHIENVCLLPEPDNTDPFAQLMA